MDCSCCNTHRNGNIFPKTAIKCKVKELNNFSESTNQPDAATSQVYYLSFKYSSTFFGHPHAHHQELQ